MSTSLAVIGGGISGLAAAWFAAADGWDVTLYEASPTVGGKLRTGSVGGVEVDLGAESLLTTRTEAVDLIGQLGLTDERIAPAVAGAAVQAGGALHPLPARTLMGIPADADALRASGLLTDAGVASVVSEPLQAPLAPLEVDVAVGALVRGRLGDEVADRLVEPLLGGVYAGRSDAISLRAAVPALATRLRAGGSLVEAARSLVGAGTRAPDAGPIFTSLRGGVGRLPAALAASGRFRVRTGVTVRALTRTPAGFALECGAVPVAERVEADAVVVALPASKAARLLRDTALGASTELARIESANLAIVTLAFAPGVTLPGGSGLLVAAGERLATKAVTLTSQKWGLAGPSTLLRASVGRAGEAHALQFDDGDLVELVRRELAPLIGVSAAPVDAMVTRWGGGLPQYAVGHVDRVARVRAAVAEVPGLAVCGAAYDGVGVPACIASARAAVTRLDEARTARGQSPA